MIIESNLYHVIINGLYVDDNSNRLVIRGKICNKNKKEDREFEEYIVLNGYDNTENSIHDKVDVYDN